MRCFSVRVSAVSLVPVHVPNYLANPHVSSINPPQVSLSRIMVDPSQINSGGRIAPAWEVEHRCPAKALLRPRPERFLLFSRRLRTTYRHVHALRAEQDRANKMVMVECSVACRPCWCDARGPEHSTSFVYSHSAS